MSNTCARGKTVNAPVDARMHDDRAAEALPDVHGLNTPEKVESPLTDDDLELVLGGLVELPNEPVDPLSALERDSTSPA